MCLDHLQQQQKIRQGSTPRRQARLRVTEHIAAGQGLHHNQEFGQSVG
jgi:hypothetical protein